MHGGDIYSDHVDIDFSVNLNPVNPSDEDEAAIRDAVAAGIENAGVYPDILQRNVRSMIALSEGVKSGCVCAANGASELIMAAVSMISPGRALLIEPSFLGYRRSLDSAGCEIIECFLKEEDEFCLKSDVISYLSKGIDMVFLQDPWNPVGKNIDDGLLNLILDKADSLGITVVLDESFFMLSDKSLKRSVGYTAELIDRYSGLIIIKSYTKSFALPGFRMGYAVSSEKMTEKLTGHLPEWNLSSVADAVMGACAKTVLKGEYLKSSAEYIQTERELFIKDLKSLGLKVYGSDTVFVLFKYEGGTDLYGELLKKGILIRDCKDIPGLGRGFYRVSVKSRADNERLIRAIGETINGN